MNVLIFLSDIGSECTDVQELDIAISEAAKGNQIYLLNCDNSLGLCVRNPKGNSAYCKSCQLFRSLNIKHYAPKNTIVLNVCDILKELNTINDESLSYSNSKELRALTYDGFDIGMGVMSTYISVTRNLNPQINKTSRKYFDALVNVQLRFRRVLSYLQKQYNFGLVVFSNGRNIPNKTILNFCQQSNIDYWCVETKQKRTGTNYIDNYWCTIPHDLTIQGKKIKEGWNNSPIGSNEKINIAKSFYENRRNANPAGDKVYTINQISGQLPDDWNANKENIVIFNSSEDEFCAVSKEYDKEALFASQIAGIHSILEHYREDPSKMFTLRVHPNLMKIGYKYHTDLYKIKYPNFRVIPSDSPISTYSLIDEADKVIVFGSTTGIESVYWGKPVICLAGAYYRDLNVVYKPNDIEELWQLISTENLKCKFNDNVLAFGYYIMGNNFKTTDHLNIDYYKANFFGKNIYAFKSGRLFGSNYLYALLVSILEKLSKRTLFFDDFKNIPIIEE